MRRTNVSVWMHVCEWVNGLLGCIGILKCDWQGRSLLGEIINRVEPVISPRQPWKETADSQGSYWEFQRCRLTDLGPGPHHTETASQVVPESALINVPSHPPSFILPGCAAFSEKVSFFYDFFKHFKSPFVSTLPTLHFSYFVVQIVFSAVLHFSTCKKVCLYRTQLNPHN